MGKNRKKRTKVTESKCVWCKTYDSRTLEAAAKEVLQEQRSLHRACTYCMSPSTLKGSVVTASEKFESRSNDLKFAIGKALCCVFWRIKTWKICATNVGTWFRTNGL
jgi:hypothetical protein